MKRNEPIILLNGQYFVVECAIRENQKSESEAFIDSLDNLEKAKILRIVKRYADFGRIYNKQQFRKVEGPLFEFKNYQTRILMYHCAKGCIALTHGFFKKSPKIPKNEIEKGKKIKEEYDEIRRGWNL
jgi:phage-related protein